MNRVFGIAAFFFFFLFVFLFLFRPFPSFSPSHTHTRTQTVTSTPRRLPLSPDVVLLSVFASATHETLSPVLLQMIHTRARPLISFFSLPRFIIYRPPVRACACVKFSPRKDVVERRTNIINHTRCARSYTTEAFAGNGKI